MDTLRTSEIYSDSTFMLIAIERIHARSSKTNFCYQSYGEVDPIAIVVCSPERIYALDMAANPTDLDLLRQKIPDLDSIIVLFIKKHTHNILVE